MTPNICKKCSRPLPANSSASECEDCLLDREDEVEDIISGAIGLPPAPTPEQLAPHFPNHDIVRLIGQGGMGDVFEARHRILRRRVAIKVVRLGVVPDDVFEARFAREGRAMAQVVHENIVAVHAAGKAGPYHYIELEYVDGCSLRQLMQGAKLEPEHALSIVVQTCKALEFAHDLGVVHRDVKPDNILITRDGHVKVADFGLAKLLRGHRRSVTITGTYQAMGTPIYMAPEQIETPKVVDHRADIYSLGVVLYETLTGKLPIGRFPPASKRVGVDFRLDEIISKALQKDPELRYQTATDVRTAVQRVSTKAPVPNRKKRRVERGASPFAAVAVLVVSVLLAGWAIQRTFFSASASETPQTAVEYRDRARDFRRAGAVHLASSDYGKAHVLDPQLEGLQREYGEVLLDEARAYRDGGRLALAAVAAARAQSVSPSPETEQIRVNMLLSAQREISTGADLSRGPGPLRFDASTVELRGRITCGGLYDDLSDGSARLRIEGVEARVGVETWSATLENVSDGLHRMHLVASYGDQLEIPIALGEFFVDGHAPRFDITSPKDGEVVGTHLRVQGTNADVSATTISVSGTDVQLGPGSTAWSGDVELAEGRQTLVATARDELGHSLQLQRTVIVDGQLPVIDLLGNAEVVTRNRTERVQIRVLDERLERVSFDGQQISVDEHGGVSFFVGPLERDGSEKRHQIEAVDAANNIASAFIVARRDNSKPSVELDREPPLIAFAGMRKIVSGNYEDGAACRLLAGASGDSAPAGASGIGDGRFELDVAVPEHCQVGDKIPFQFRIADAAGNEALVEEVLLIRPVCWACDGRMECKRCTGKGFSGDGCANQDCKNGWIEQCPDCDGRRLTKCGQCKGKVYYYEDCPDCENRKRPCPGRCDRGKKEYPCDEPLCENGKVRQQRITGGYDLVRCDVCEGDDLILARCKVCIASPTPGIVPCSSKTCKKSGPATGQVSKKCDLCKRGFTSTPCSTCEAGFERYECSRCQGEPPGKPCPNCKEAPGDCRECQGSGCMPEQPNFGGVRHAHSGSDAAGRERSQGEESRGGNGKAIGQAAAPQILRAPLLLPESVTITISENNKATISITAVSPDEEPRDDGVAELPPRKFKVSLSGTADVPPFSDEYKAEFEEHWRRKVKEAFESHRITAKSPRGGVLVVPARSSQPSWRFAL